MLLLVIKRATIVLALKAAIPIHHLTARKREKTTAEEKILKREKFENYENLDLIYVSSTGIKLKQEFQR